MEKKKIKLSDWRVQTLILFVFFLVGIIWHAWDLTYPFMVILTPYVLLISGIWAIYKSLKYKYVIAWIGIAYIVTFFLEVVGAETDLIFGPYFYGDGLGLKLLNVPVVIGLNWVFIIFSLVLFSQWLVKEFLNLEINAKIEFALIIVLTASLATLFDFILEPAAIGLNYWNWTLTSNPYDIPIQNYIAWFLISLLFAFTFLLIPKEKRIELEESPHSPWFVVIQVFFFIGIRIILLF